MNKQQAWDEWHEGILGNKAPDIKLSSHGRAFSAGWDAAMAALFTDGEHSALVRQLVDSVNLASDSAGLRRRGVPQLPAKGKLDGFCSFIGSEPVENDGGWSLEVWNAAWEACEREQEAKKPVETSAPPS
jgi:hypothetical protein